MDPLQAKLTEILAAADWDSDHDESFFAAIDDIREQAKAEFAYDRLQSYYLAHRDICKPAASALERARSLLSISPPASLVFAITSAEVCIKNIILRPMTYGFVHQDYAAKFISDLATLHSGWDRFKDLLREVLREKVGVDLYAVTIEGSSVLLWPEFTRLVVARNGVVHRGEDTDQASASSALQISAQLLYAIVPKLLSNIGLNLDGAGLVERQK